MSNIEENNPIEDIKKNITTYLKGVRSEWGKITWPQRDQVTVETVVVLFVVAIITLFVYFVDVGFKDLFTFLKLN